MTLSPNLLDIPLSHIILKIIKRASNTVFFIVMMTSSGTPQFEELNDVKDGHLLMKKSS